MLLRWCPGGVNYLEAAKIPGDFVECGVWRGGSSMMAAMSLNELGLQPTIWLYDTFEGMPPPVSGPHVEGRARR